MTYLCEFPGCGKNALAKNLCGGHYQQTVRGLKLKEIVSHLSPEERFWKYVNKTDTCWLWLKHTSDYGYGHYKPDKNSNPVLAHRYAYEITYKIKLGRKEILDHLCRVKRCVNPAHLDKVTQHENVKRMQAFHSQEAEIERLKKILRIHGIDF